ncbi:uncharacterized protein EMH_0013520 [Eimeria mitis]|uniref:Uncharacterized protein n=1 Tax=Eimeria mitis TaxID=44415 RepID=U6K4S1_9EIME|nr:uncharacterized protein EMH_0013520 [Eimeria mitis]CDJ32735.1 hypothetical protein EMH_0013520 [Eimeria mitis]
MCGGPAGIAEDGAVKTYMLDYDHGFTAPMIGRKSRIPHRSLHIISYAVVATVVIFLVVQCALQLAGRRNFNGWSRRRLAEQAAERKGSSAGDRDEAAQGAGYALPFLSAGTAGVGGYLTGSEGGTKQKPGHPAHQLPAGPKGAWADPGKSSAGGTQPLVFELVDMSGGSGKGRESGERPTDVLERLPWQRMTGAQGPERPAGSLDAEDPSGLPGTSQGTKQKPGHPAQQLPADAEGAWADPRKSSAGSTPQLLFPWRDLSAVGATGGESEKEPADVPQQLPWQRMPDAQGPERRAGRRGAEEPSGLPGTSQGTTEEPGHPAQQLPADAEGAWAGPGASSTGTTQQLEFELVDMSGRSGKGRKSGERPEDVPEQLPWQPMTDLQAPEHPAGIGDAEEAGQEPAKSQKPTAAPAVREYGGALTAVQGKQSSGDSWGTEEASAAGEMPHPSAGASQQTTASAVTKAGGPLVAGLKRVATSAAGALESFYQPDFPAGWMYAFPLIGERETGENLNTVLRFLQSAGSQPRPPHPGRFRIRFRGFSIEISVSHTVSSPGWPSDRILQAAAIFMENFCVDATALFENGDSRRLIERSVELKTEAGSNITGCLTIQLVEETHTDNCKA